MRSEASWSETISGVASELTVAAPAVPPLAALLLDAVSGATAAGAAIFAVAVEARDAIVETTTEVTAAWLCGLPWVGAFAVGVAIESATAFPGACTKV